MSNLFGKAHKYTQLSLRIYNCYSRLRNSLDCLVCNQCPYITESIQCYYGDYNEDLNNHLIHMVKYLPKSRKKYPKIIQGYLFILFELYIIRISELVRRLSHLKEDITLDDFFIIKTKTEYKRFSSLITKWSEIWNDNKISKLNVFV